MTLDVSDNAIHLNDLANSINEEHRRVVGKLSSALPHAMRCGELLHEAKSGVPRGTWTQWLSNNFDVEGGHSVRTAQNYMRLHEYREQIEPENITSLREAMRWLNGRPRSDSGGWVRSARTQRKAQRRREQRAREQSRRLQAGDRELLRRQMRTKGGADAAKVLTGIRQSLDAAQDYLDSDSPNQTKKTAMGKVVASLYRAEDELKGLL